jgi:hypothetical protein
MFLPLSSSAQNPCEEVSLYDWPPPGRLGSIHYDVLRTICAILASEPGQPQDLTEGPAFDRLDWARIFPYDDRLANYGVNFSPPE